MNWKRPQMTGWHYCKSLQFLQGRWNLSRNRKPLRPYKSTLDPTHYSNILISTICLWKHYVQYQFLFHPTCMTCTIPWNPLVPVFSDQTLQFSINLFICFHAGLPIASKVVIVAPSSLVKVQFYNFTFTLFIWFHSVSKFLKGAQNRSEYLKMVTYMYM